MPTKRNYRRKSVNQVSIAELVADQGFLRRVTVGLDVAKDEIVVCICWRPGESFSVPWSVKNPSELRLLVKLLQELKAECTELTVGLESTGTYSDSIRYLMHQAGLSVHRVSGKSVADYSEIFDGVPSQHDGKDAAIIAELVAYGKGTAWEYQADDDLLAEIKHQVARLEAFRTQANQWLCRLEGLLTRHWPELLRYLELTSATLRRICEHYTTPEELARDPDAAQRLRSWGRGLLRFTKIQEIIESAKETTGLPMNDSQRAWLKEAVAEAERASALCKESSKSLQTLAKQHPAIAPYVEAVGGPTLCAIFASVGDPRNYSSSAAFLKALGLNLKERSSGKYQGKLTITKRGPSKARKILYYWALRAIQRPELKQWYSSFKRIGSGKASGNSEHRAIKGLVAMMRKLCKSLWYVYQHGEMFQYSKVFPGRPLDPPKKRKPRRKSTPSSS